MRAPVIKARRGNETKLIIANDNGRAEHNRDRGLINLIAEGRQTYQLVLDNAEVPIARLVREQGKCKKRFYKLLRVAMLSPDSRNLRKFKNCLVPAAGIEPATP